MSKVNNRDYIEHIKSYILNQYITYESINGIVDRFFFDSDNLKKNTEAALEVISNMFGYKILSEIEFVKLFDISIKEFRHNHTTSMAPSISLRKSHLETWLTKERIESLNWNSDEIITYRTRYLNYLESIGRAKSIVNETDRSSLEIIKKIGDPLSNDVFFTRGLVVGSVQSGKTANFNAVINSSIDVGYKLIIVLSGIMEDLRRQTQTRIEKEVVGPYLGSDKFDGVGKISSFGQLGKYKNVNQIIVPTSGTNDFNRAMQRAHFSLNNTNILICKKNTSVLQNLILWLNEYLIENNDKHNIPFIIIDDEADNASLNNLGHKGKEYANKINGHIRALLALFNKKTYIGYTATPFANVLQDVNETPENKWLIRDAKNNTILEFDQVDNLFPHDFIELLIPPSNYLGPKNFFETRIEEIKKIEPLIGPAIKDYVPSFPSRVYKEKSQNPFEVIGFSNKDEFDTYFYKHNGYLDFTDHKDYRDRTRASKQFDDYPKNLPKSLEEAVKCYILSIAVRLSRKQEMSNSKLFHPHNTMLIHISRYSAWQTKTKDLLEKYLLNLKTSINSDGLKDEGSIFLEFERIWVKYFSYAINNIQEYLPEGYEDVFLTKRTFEDVKQFLFLAIDGIDVKAVNTLTKDELDYSKGEKKYIVVGGNKLSRGFTLEGLTINYFIRNTNYADTLLQMGRWFGYRPGYLDCCKLFTTTETLEKFDQCTWTIEELEAEFKQMSLDGKKPIDYATRVLTHPGTLQITRAGILKNSTVVKWSYADHLLQTTKFHLDKNRINHSWKSFKEFYANNSDDFVKENDYLVLKTTPNNLLTLLDLPNTFSEDFIKPFKMFLELANNLNKLTNWTIAIKTSGASKNVLKKADTGFGSDIKLTERGGPKRGYYREKLINEKIFAASGASSNIVTSGKDFSVTLNESEIKKAKTNFIRNKNPEASETEIENLVKKSNFPENIYRRRIPESEGLLVIYLMDLHKVFLTVEKGEEGEIENTDNVDLAIPLIGYAIGIPPIEENVGGTYLLNKYILENIEKNPESSEDDFDEDTEFDFEETKELLE
ncbi:MAG: Z1 domain-containing protein [Flavobacterium sp.]|nr:Z1 domain-containing protein [Flavobacterium sp.]